MIVYACTSNRGKLDEIQEAARLFFPCRIEIEPLPALEQIAAPEETGSDFEENAHLKAIYYSRFSSGLVLADDSGLEVDSLNGAPGIYSARYAGEHSTDAANNALLLHNLHGIDIRRGRFVCAIALAHAGQIVHVATGTVEGVILQAETGSGGFGYDPLFFYPPLGRSFAELTREEKLRVSHRGRALREMLTWLSDPDVSCAAVLTGHLVR
jgi:XTP/dITP diphosphohydrolase